MISQMQVIEFENESKQEMYVYTTR